MKRDITAISKILKSLRRVFKRGTGYMNPLRDWTIGLALATIIFIFGVCYIVFDFYTQFGGTTEEPVFEEQTIRYRADEIRTFADAYNEKEVIFNELRNNRSYVPPPLITEDTTTTTEVTPSLPLAEEGTDE